MIGFVRSIRGLPHSCRLFFRCAVLCIALITLHAVMILLGLWTLPKDKFKMVGSTVQMLSYYGGSQLLFAALALVFTVNAVRDENQVLMEAATWLIGSVCMFDVSLLYTAWRQVRDRDRTRTHAPSARAHAQPNRARACLCLVGRRRAARTSSRLRIPWCSSSTTMASRPMWTR